MRNRTAAPALHVLVPYLIVGFSMLTAWRDYHQQNWGNAAFAVFNAVLAADAIRAYIGLRASIVDMGLGVVNWLYVERRRSGVAPSPATDAPSTGRRSSTTATAGWPATSGSGATVGAACIAASRRLA